MSVHSLDPLPSLFEDVPLLVVVGLEVVEVAEAGQHRYESWPLVRLK